MCDMGKMPAGSAGDNSNVLDGTVFRRPDGRLFVVREFFDDGAFGGDVCCGRVDLPEAWDEVPRDVLATYQRLPDLRQLGPSPGGLQ